MTRNDKVEKFYCFLKLFVIRLDGGLLEIDPIVESYCSAVMPQAAEAARSSLQSLLGRLEKRRKMARAFSLWRIKPNDCNRRVAIMELSSPVSTDLCLASSLHTA